MSTSNDSTVVLRLPQELKDILQKQAEQLDVSLSEVIRLKLMIAENAIHREPVIRLGGGQYRLWDVLRPDVLVYDLVDSKEDARGSAVFDAETGDVDMPLCGRVSDAVDGAIGRARDIAIRLGSTEIAPVHLAIALIEREEYNAARAVAYLTGDRLHVLKELESEARAFPTSRRPPRNGDVPLTKAAVKVLKSVRVEGKLYRRDVADSTMMLLALLRDAESTVPTLTALRITYTAVADLIKR